MGGTHVPAEQGSLVFLENQDIDSQWPGFCKVELILAFPSWILLSSGGERARRVYIRHAAHWNMKWVGRLIFVC